MPCVAWGFGKTPRYNFEVFPLLAVAWGPLIQLFIFKQFDGDPAQNDDFDVDGHYVIAPARQEGLEQDLRIESLHFIDEGMLACVTSNGEVRVLQT